MSKLKNPIEVFVRVLMRFPGLVVNTTLHPSNPCRNLTFAALTSIQGWKNLAESNANCVQIPFASLDIWKYPS